MAKLSEKTAATVLAGTDELPINQNTTTTPVSKRSALTLIRDWITDNATRLTVSSGTLTSSTPVSLTQTWNNAATTFTAAKVNMTDTASASGSLLQDWQVGGTSVARIDKTGKVYTNEINPSSGTYTKVGALYSLTRNVGFGYHSGCVTATVDFRLGTSLDGVDVFIARDAANALALRNGTNSQSLAVYNTYTDASNYERLRLYGTAGSAYTIASEAAGTGTVRDLVFATGLSIADAKDIVIGATTGTKIGQTTSKLAFYGSTPVVKQVLATGAAHTVDDVITFLQTIGLCKQA